MKKILIGLLFMFAVATCLPQFYENADSAYLHAFLEKKPIFLIFSGSDWCPNCIRFEKNILVNTSFQTFAKENLIVLRADFPQKRKLQKVTIHQNEHLAELYNPNGEFPTIIILTPEKSIAGSIEYRNQSPDEIVNILKETIDKLKLNE